MYVESSSFHTLVLRDAGRVLWSHWDDGGTSPMGLAVAARTVDSTPVGWLANGDGIVKQKDSPLGTPTPKRTLADSKCRPFRKYDPPTR
jgi:hypothetical protein